MDGMTDPRGQRKNLIMYYMALAYKKVNSKLPSHSANNGVEERSVRDKNQHI